MTFFIAYTYIFRSEHGILSTCYPASQLEDFGGPLCCECNGWKEMKKISLREAAKHQAPWNLFTANACKCTTGCRTQNNANVWKRILVVPVTVMLGNDVLINKISSFFVQMNQRCNTKTVISRKKMKWQVKRVSCVSKNINSNHVYWWHLLIQVPWLKSLDLMQNDKLTLEAIQCLNDKHIHAAHKIMHQQFDKLHGLQSTLLEQVGTAQGFSPVDGRGEGKYRLKLMRDN